MKLSLPVLCVLVLVFAPFVCARSGQEPVSLKEWTFLVFVNADNNLDGAGVDDLKEMTAAGSNESVDIVAEMDRWHGPAKRYHVEKGKAEVVQELGEVNMGDWRHLVEFVSWGVEHYPARRYALVIWNHGSGWNKHLVDLDTRGVSYDDTDDSHITTPQLGSALEKIHGVIGGKLDILAFDACLMNMIEVSYQVKEYCDYVVGSEETEPGDGWPYDKILTRLVASPSMSAEKLAATIVRQYKASYGMQSTTQSAVRATRLEELRLLLDNLCECCRNASEDDVRQALDKALDKVTRFYYKSYIDLFHFVSLFEDAVDDSVCRKAARAVLALEKRIVAANGVSGLPFMKKKARGISIYFPTKNSYYSHYANLAFCKDSGWDDFLTWYLGLDAVSVTPGDKRLKLLVH